LSNKLGKYEIREKLGEGATAEVYCAVDTSLDREVALKLLKPALVAETSTFERFRQEARAAAVLFHPNIATVFEIGEEEGRYFIAMRYIEGNSLDRVLKEDGPLPWDEVLRMATQLGEALDYAHGEGFLHRDVKPSNIIQSEKGEHVLTDFGLVRAMMNTGITTHTGALLGTPAYIAPEIWNGEDASPASDQYALACVLYEAMTGNVLFEGTTPQAIITRHLIKGPEFPETWPDGTPAGFQAVLQCALQANPLERYEKLMEFPSALAHMETPTQERARLEVESKSKRDAEEIDRRDAEQSETEQAKKHEEEKDAIRVSEVHDRARREANGEAKWAAKLRSRTLRDYKGVATSGIVIALVILLYMGIATLQSNVNSKATSTASVMRRTSTAPAQQSDQVQLTLTAVAEAISAQVTSQSRTQTASTAQVRATSTAQAKSKATELILTQMASTAQAWEELEIEEQIIERGTIRIGLNSPENWPFSFQQDDINNGFEIDLINEIVNRLFGENISIEWIPLFANYRYAIDNGKIDLLIGNIIHNTSGEEWGLLTSNYFLDGYRLMVRKDSGISNIEDLDRGSICALDDQYMDSIINKNFYDAGYPILLIVFVDIEDAIQSLYEERCDAISAPWSILLNKLREYSDNLIIGEILTANPEDFDYGVEPIAMMIPNGNSGFRDDVNKILEGIITDGTWQLFYDQWFIDPPPWTLEELLNEPPSRR